MAALQPEFDGVEGVLRIHGPALRAFWNAMRLGAADWRELTAEDSLEALACWYAAWRAAGRQRVAALDAALAHPAPELLVCWPARRSLSSTILHRAGKWLHGDASGQPEKHLGSV